MKIFLLVCLLFVHVASYVPAQDRPQPGFGVQPGLIPPKTDPKTLTSRILSSTEYKLTPGDVYELVVIIEKTERFPLVLNRDYNIDIPYIGNLDVEGMYFSELKQEIVRRIKARIPVQFVDFVLTAPALFDVFIYGGVKNPGIATVNPLSRISEAILLAGGPVEGASYRQVRLARDGETQTFDLSKFATEADLDQNPVLEPNDKIYVPQATKIVEVKGEVKYPGYYELVPSESLADLLLMSGGYIADSSANVIQVLRQEGDGSTVVLTVDRNMVEKTEVQHLDIITFGQRGLTRTARITIDGALYGEPLKPDKPVRIPQDRIVANIPYVADLTLLDVLDQLGGPTPLAEWNRSYLQRESGEKIPVMLRKLWDERAVEYDIKLAPGDLIVIPMSPPTVFVAGEVNDAGAFPFRNGYTVADYLVAAGGVDPDTGSRERIYFIDDSGNRNRVALETNVTDPGTLIYVSKNAWAITEKTVTRALVITGLISAIVAILSDITNIVYGIPNP